LFVKNLFLNFQDKASVGEVGRKLKISTYRYRLSEKKDFRGGVKKNGASGSRPLTMP